MGADTRGMNRCVCAVARGSSGRDGGPVGRWLVSTLPGIVLHIVHIGAVTSASIICAAVVDEGMRPPDAVQAVLVDANLTMGGRGRIVLLVCLTPRRDYHPLAVTDNA